MAEQDNVVDPPYRFDPYMTLTEVGWSGKDIVAVQIEYNVSRPSTVPFQVKFPSDVSKLIPPFDGTQSGLKFLDDSGSNVAITDPDVSKDMFGHVYLWSKPVVVFASSRGRSISAMFLINISKVKSALNAGNNTGQPLKDFNFTIITPAGLNTKKKTDPVYWWIVFNKRNFGDAQAAYDDWVAHNGQAFRDDRENIFWTFTDFTLPEFSEYRMGIDGNGWVAPFYAFFGTDAEANAFRAEEHAERGTFQDKLGTGRVEIVPAGEINDDTTSWEININAYRKQKTFPTKDNELLLNPPNAFRVPQVPLDDGAEYKGGVHEGGSNGHPDNPIRSYTLTVKVEFKELKVTITGGPEGGPPITG
jgi:hypothetical protein